MESLDDEVMDGLVAGMIDGLIHGLIDLSDRKMVTD